MNKRGNTNKISHLIREITDAFHRIKNFFKRSLIHENVLMQHIRQPVQLLQCDNKCTNFVRITITF